MRRHDIVFHTLILAMLDVKQILKGTECNEQDKIDV